MTPRELRASLSLASLYALRMLGLFLVLPVFAVHAAQLPGGVEAWQVGLVLGAYSLTQGVLQLPFGMASDRFGRKPVIVFGLILFALGSLVAAMAQDITFTIIGRALQGMGAISAAVTACIADQTRDSQRTKAMALVGASIGLTFALSLVLAPALYAAVGMQGLFHLTAVLAVCGIAVVLWGVPAGVDTPLVSQTPGQAAATSQRTSLRDVLRDAELMRLNFGIFALHFVQMAMFVVLPAWLVERAGLPLPDHWMLYLPVVLVSFALMTPPLGWSERQGKVRLLFLVSVALVALVQVGYALGPGHAWWFGVLLLIFFTAFNILEALVPSMVSRLAPADARGTALGVYNTTQAIGLFAGGAGGGWAASSFGGAGVFVLCAAVMLLWWGVAAGARRWPGRST
jgi:MFS family permease